MIGKQIINNIFEFFTTIRRTCGRVCFNRDKNKGKQQWEIDKDLFDFDSVTLLDEYLEIGK
jgi:hypothetical protein